MSTYVPLRYSPKNPPKPKPRPLGRPTKPSKKSLDNDAVRRTLMFRSSGG